MDFVLVGLVVPPKIQLDPWCLASHNFYMRFYNRLLSCIILYIIIIIKLKYEKKIKRKKIKKS